MFIACRVTKATDTHIICHTYHFFHNKVITRTRLIFAFICTHCLSRLDSRRCRHLSLITWCLLWQDFSERIELFWDNMLCYCLCSFRSFNGQLCFHLQGQGQDLKTKALRTSEPSETAYPAAELTKSSASQV